GFYVIDVVNTYMFVANFNPFNVVPKGMPKIEMKGNPFGKGGDNPFGKIDFDKDFGKAFQGAGGFGPSPVTATLMSALFALVVYPPCLIFMYLGACKIRKLTGRGLAITGVIIATVLGGLFAIWFVLSLIGIITLLVTFFQIIQVVAMAGATTVLLLASIKGF